jgi:hypothetical protein
MVAPHAPLAQQGGAQIAVQPSDGHGGAGAGLSQAAAGTGAQGPPSQEYLGIAMALKCLASVMADADTTRNLEWQWEEGGGITKLTMWKLEATASPSLQVFAYMQPGKAFLVVGHSMGTIYSTTTNIASFHGKVVLFTGDSMGTRGCVPVILPPQSALKWKKCSVIDDKEKLLSWYADNLSEYGKLWDPMANDGQKVELHIPRMNALPLQAASLYHQLKGAVIWRGQGRGGQNPNPPSDVTGPPCSHTAGGGGEVAGTLPREG